jgi:alpha-D-ribose 1-methylphosphonate 5-triphosphate synthase subunit PhnH
MKLSIDGGFADLVFDAQNVFRGVMDALARPGSVQTLDATTAPPAPLSPELGAVALTLCDHDTPVWLDPALATPAVIEWLRFHSGSPLTDEVSAAHFAFVSDAKNLPRLENFAQGTDEYPDRSTTIVLAATGTRRAVTLTGPGIKTPLATTLALPGGDFLAQWSENRERFPRGIDLLLCGAGEIVGLPRTTMIAEV